MLASAPVLASPPDFAANIVRRGVNGQRIGKPSRVYVSQGRVRIEMADLPGYILIDAATAAWLIRPEQHSVVAAMRSSELSEIFVSVNPDHPCEQWQLAHDRATPGRTDGWRCTLNSPSQFEIQDLKGGVLRRRVDSDLSFPSQQLEPDGSTWNLEDVQRGGAQPAGWFEIPAGYVRFDPRALLDKIKKSDVWAAPP